MAAPLSTTVEKLQKILTNKNIEMEFNEFKKVQVLAIDKITNGLIFIDEYNKDFIMDFLLKFLLDNKIETTLKFKPPFFQQVIKAATTISKDYETI